MFLGDLINYSLLEPFHTSIQIHRADDSDTCAEVKERIRRLVAQARDLTVAPAVFPGAGSGGTRRSSSVEAWPKGGRFHNELTRFRYDAILHIGERALPLRRKRSGCGWTGKASEADRRGVAADGGGAPGDIWRFAIFRTLVSTGKSWRCRGCGSPRRMNRWRGCFPGLTGRLLAESSRRISARSKSWGIASTLSWLNAGVNGTFEAALTRRDVAVWSGSLSAGGGSAAAQLRGVCQPSGAR